MVKIIAEFCQNHNGDWSVLKDMIWQSAEAGATVGKIQTIFANMLQNREDLNAIRPYAGEYERLKKLELSWDDHARFVEECQKAKLIPMTTCYSREHAKRIHECGFRWLKVAASHAERPLRFVAFQMVISGKPADRDDIGLYATPRYPTPFEHIALWRMDALRKHCHQVGLSDHSAGHDMRASEAAILMGADWIERHVTILDSHKTKDGPVSIYPSQIKELLAFAREHEEKQHYLRERFG